MNYPIKKTYNKIISTKNRGMNLEDDINLTNEYYLANNIAVIYKKPTPIQVVKVLYPARNKAMINEAYYKIPSTTDYNGIYKGRYIDFECKVTNSRTSFPLRNIHNHQINHLKNINYHGGIGFIIVYFKYYNEYFLLPYAVLKDYINNNDKKSIPYNIFKEKCFKIKEGFQPRLDYLKQVDYLLEN